MAQRMETAMGVTGQQHIPVFVQSSRIHHYPLTHLSQKKLIARMSKYVGRDQTLKLCQKISEFMDPLGFEVQLYIPFSL
jgi:hypothetical protein